MFDTDTKLDRIGLNILEKSFFYTYNVLLCKPGFPKLFFQIAPFRDFKNTIAP